MGRANMGAWIEIDDSRIHYTVCHEVVEFEIGGRSSGAELVATEGGLVNLINRSTEALTELRAAQHRHPRQNSN